jgi:ribosomal protein S7
MVYQNLEKMQRNRHLIYKRTFPRFNMCLSRRSSILNRLVGVGTRNGHRSYIFNQVYLALVYLKELTRCSSSVELLEGAVRVLEPPMECRRTRRSGRPFFIPSPCRAARRQSLGVRFLWDGVIQRSRKEQQDFSWALVIEIMNLMCRTIKERRTTYSFVYRTEFLDTVTQYMPSARFLTRF